MDPTKLDSATLGLVVVVLVAIGAFLGWLWKYTSRDRNIARKDEYPLSQNLATKDEVDAVDKRVDDLQLQVNERFSAMAKASSAGREKIYGAISELEKENSAQSATLKMINQTMVRMDQKIDALQARK